VARAEAYLHAKFHLDPSNRLATIHQRYRQDRQTDRQRSDSVGRTVAQLPVTIRLLRLNITIIVWPVWCWTLPFVPAFSRLDDSVLDDRRLPDQC